MPKCTINGKSVEVPQGATIIEAYKAAHTDIAHYCWHPGLSVAGVCRLCMVEIEGNPKMQIACNTQVTEGMVINNVSDKVKDTVRWGMDFHLINHPLDCPICDQAGECGLQEQYMKFGKYDPEMAEHKVKKHKVVDLGSKIVLDSERCILCSRCVRFTAEVSKTFEFGIFNRGDHSEIGTVDNKPVENNYAVNTVDICPVGALTSKDFRFRQRVWYLKEAETICPGCSTGCKVKGYYNEEGLFRFKPVHDPEVNGYWMCDEGRKSYQFVNRQARLTIGRYGRNESWEDMQSGTAALEAGAKIRAVAQDKGADRIAVIVTGQYTVEEYDAFLKFFVAKLGSKNIFHWQNQPEKVNEFDGILFRGDRNPNTKGLEAAFKKSGITSKWSDFEKGVKEKRFDLVVVAGPENLNVFPDVSEKVALCNQVETVVWLSAGDSAEVSKIQAMTWQIPLKTFFEKDGTFINFAGKERKFKRATTVCPSTLTLEDVAKLFEGQRVGVNLKEDNEGHIKTNFFVQQRGSL